MREPRHWGVTQGKNVGVAGLGGVGHMGVKFAHALGAHAVVSRNAGEMRKHAGSFDFMLDFCGAHNITADVKYRFSIDMASLKSE